MRALSMWTVYERPSDYPEHYVARRFVIDQGGFRSTEDVVLAETLAGVRTQLPPDLYCMPRQDGDEPQIVEVWL